MSNQTITCTTTTQDVEEEGPNVDTVEDEDFEVVDIELVDGGSVPTDTVHDEDEEEVSAEEYENLLKNYGDLITELEDPTEHQMEQTTKKREATGLHKVHRAWDAFQLKTREDYATVTREDFQDRLDFAYGKSSILMMKYEYLSSTATHSYLTSFGRQGFKYYERFWQQRGNEFAKPGPENIPLQDEIQTDMFDKSYPGLISKRVLGRFVGDLLPKVVKIGKKKLMVHGMFGAGAAVIINGLMRHVSCSHTLLSRSLSLSLSLSSRSPCALSLPLPLSLNTP